MKMQDLFPKARKTGPIIVIGELLIDFIPSGTGMRLDEPGPVIKTVSGSSGIYACAAAAMHVPCSIICKLGEDPFSRMSRTAMEQQGVSTDLVSCDPSGKLGLAFVEYTESGRNYAYYRSDSVGSRLSPADIPAEAVAGAQLVHLPGMLLELNANMRDACFSAVELAKAAGVTVSFDPNLRKELGANPDARARLERMLSLSDIIEPTLEEARIITGRQAIPDVLAALHAMGPRVVVLTRDKDGALMSAGGQVYEAPGIDVEVLDTTGAGDTFAGVLGACYVRNETLQTALRYANCAATLECTRRGAIGAAIPSLQEVVSLMQEQGFLPVQYLN